MAGWTYETWWPFKRTTYTQWDEDGPAEVATWAPGWDYKILDEHGNSASVWDGEGAVIFTVVSLHRPSPRYPERAFYIRQWRSPDGKVFGRDTLRMITARALKGWLRGSKTRHLFTDYDASRPDAAALLAEALAYESARKDGSSQHNPEAQSHG